ncbi:hypothetical protein BV351_05594 [Pseudomonas syringae pv. actinidiae]|nr:hypothetical protein BV351_05594 [Pseudomonas syringae pv. actinidiae]
MCGRYGTCGQRPESIVGTIAQPPAIDLPITSIMRGGTILLDQDLLQLYNMVPNHLRYRSALVPLIRPGTSPGSLEWYQC